MARPKGKPRALGVCFGGGCGVCGVMCGVVWVWCGCGDDQHLLLGKHTQQSHSLYYKYNIPNRHVYAPYTPNMYYIHNIHQDIQHTQHVQHIQHIHPRHTVHTPHIHNHDIPPPHTGWLHMQQQVQPRVTQPPLYDAACQVPPSKTPPPLHYPGARR